MKAKKKKHKSIPWSQFNNLSLGKNEEDEEIGQHA